MNAGCTFRHETINKPCKNGDRCVKGGACLFLHQNVDMSFTGPANNGNNLNMNSAVLSSGIGHGNGAGQMNMFSAGPYNGVRNGGTSWVEPKNLVGRTPAGRH